MTAAEVWFLRAEAALRGFSNETPKTCYETGIKTSFAQWGVGDATNYLASDKKPSDYKEMVPASGGKDMKALITISPKWNDTAGKEGQLEQIITQKWLAAGPKVTKHGANNAGPVILNYLRYKQTTVAAPSIRMI